MKNYYAAKANEFTQRYLKESLLKEIREEIEIARRKNQRSRLKYARGCRDAVKLTIESLRKQAAPHEMIRAIFREATSADEHGERVTRMDREI
jgi:hypothetical protein